MPVPKALSAARRNDGLELLDIGQWPSEFRVIDPLAIEKTGRMLFQPVEYRDRPANDRRSKDRCERPGARMHTRQEGSGDRWDQRCLGVVDALDEISDFG